MGQYFLIIDKSKNVCLIPIKTFADMHVDYKDMVVVKRDAVLGEIDHYVRQYLRGELDEQIN